MEYVDNISGLLFVLFPSQKNNETTSRLLTQHGKYISQACSIRRSQTEYVSRLELYDRYMSWIFMSYVSICLCSKLAGLPGLPGTLWSCTLDLPADFLGFGNRETTNTRLGAAKVPQPSVDLIYMAASACSYSLARSVCTAKFEVPTLTCCILVWNGGGGFNKHLCTLITGINNRGQLVQGLVVTCSPDQVVQFQNLAFDRNM